MLKFQKFKLNPCKRDIGRYLTLVILILICFAYSWGSVKADDLNVVRVPARTHGHSAIPSHLRERHGNAPAKFNGPPSVRSNSSQQNGNQVQYQTGGGLKVINVDKVYSSGFITYHKCPHRCEDAGIPREYCKDYKDGQWCLVEDMRRPRQMDLKLPNQDAPNSPATMTIQQGISLSPTGSSQSSPRQKRASEMREACAARPYIAAPIVNIHSIEKTGSIFNPKMIVTGSVEGVCLESAGLYYRGMFKQIIHIVTRDQFDGFKFRVIADGSERPEIRVYNIQGNYAIVPVVEDIY